MPDIRLPPQPFQNTQCLKSLGLWVLIKPQQLLERQSGLAELFCRLTIMVAVGLDSHLVPSLTSAAEKSEAGISTITCGETVFVALHKTAGGACNSLQEVT